MMKYLVFAVFACSLIFPKWTFAGEEVFSERVEGSNITGAVFHVYDGKYLEMYNNSNWSNDFTNYKVHNTIQLGINPDVLQTSTYTGGSITVKIEHEYWDDITNDFVWGTAETKTLEVSYDTDGTNLIDDLSTYSFMGGHHLKITVQSVTVLDVDDLFLESQIKVERYYDFDAAAVTGAQYEVSADSCSLRFFWDTKVGAESYELEFVHINDYKVDGTYFSLVDLNFNYYLNSTRIEINESNYTIPNIFDHGYVIFRVRAIGRKGTNFDHRYEGAWNIAESGALSSHNANQRFWKQYEYDPNMNWSHQVGYTEDGKRFEGLSFADGLGRGRQSISHNTETEQTIVSNVYYDELGRPVISDLPTPVDSVRLKHFPDFNRPSTEEDSSYRAEYFNITTVDSCDLEIGTGFSTNYGAGKYYSSNNPNKEGANAYIPDANKYPYSRVDYINDFSGRVRYTSAAGDTLSQGFGHETRFVYPSPEQSDLNRLFGSEVGDASHYTKMITIDPNEQVYVQYTDMAGRVVASYLEGPAPANTIALDSANLDTSISVLINGQLADLGTSYPSTTFEHAMFVSEDGESHTFQYQFSPEQYENACLDGSICFDCMYDLSLTVMDDCGVTYWDSTVVVNGSTFDTICNTNDTLTYATTVNLPRGQYTVSKSLEVNQSAIDQYWCYYVENDTCSSTLPDFFNAYYASESFLECYPDSTYEVPDSLNGCEQYKEMMLQDMIPGGQYAVYADSSGFMTSNDPTSIFYSDVWENIDFFDANGDTIFVANTAGDTVTPDQLTENEFIGFFEDEWALSLLPEHPEYCYLEFCDSNVAGVSFDDSLYAIYSYEDACAAGYLMPLGESSDLMFVNSCDSSLVDPFFDTGAGGAGYLDSLSDDMNNYLTIGSSTYSIWEAALFSSMCSEISTSAQADSCISYHFNRPDSCELDLFWTSFREIYVDLKADYYYKAMHAHAVVNGCENDCIGSDEIGCEDYADKYPRFLNLETYYGYDPSANLDSLQNVYSQGLANGCQSSCEQYASDWLEALDSCDFSSLNSTQMDNLYDDLVELCMFGCDSLHPMGATTTPTDSVTAGGHATIDDVLEDYLGSNYEDEWCTELLVSAPGPYQSTDDMLGILEQPLDTCACDAILQAQYDLENNNTQGFTYVEEMLAFNTGISMADADHLICACEEAACTTWSPGHIWDDCGPSIPAPDPSTSGYTIPATLSCNPTECEVDCAEVTAEMDTLETRFVLVADFENTQNYETIVENYLNAEFGYHLYYADYAEFIGMCGADSLNPYCTVSDAALELSDVLTLLANRGQLTNPSSNEVELADANIVYANTDALQYLYTDDDYWSSQADSTLTMHLDSGNCSITLTAFDGFDFSSIVQFGTLAPTTEGCSGNNGFEVGVIYLDCGQLQTATLTGNSGCFEINECICYPDSTLKLCDDWILDLEGPCYEPYLSQMYMNALSDYNLQLDSLYDDFTADYNAQCAEAFETEQLVHTTQVRRYQTTLFYYDQAGNLVKTVAPEGINGSFNSSDTDINTSRESVTNMTTFGAADVPNWDYETTYEYNTYNQLVSTTNPDQEGDTKFWYDRYGRIAASQNPVQWNLDLYSYTKYDEQGRPIEVGQTEQGTPPSEADLKANDKGAAFETWVDAGDLSEVTRTTYDVTLSTAIDNKFAVGTLRNLRLRVSTVAYFSAVSGSTDFETDFESATHYAYDIHGNVIETIQDVPLLSPMQQDVKSTKYEFELISGNVKRVVYQEDAIDEMEHTYEYDKLNRLTDVYTAQDSVHKTHEANYRYYDYGPLARKEIGKNKVQGMDFAYTINGWLKGMNASTLDSTRDMGNDAAEGFYTSNPEIHELVSNDVVGYTMGYFDGDYQAIGTSSMEMTYSGTTFGNWSAELYNGNIRHTVTSIYNMGTLGAAYKYDQLQRLKDMRAFQELTNANTWSGVSATTDYANSYSYDRNGNILTLQRNATSTLGLDMDNFTYHYQNIGGNKSNQLAYVSDAALNDGVGNDILSGMGATNYQYDEIGQLLSDTSEGVSLMQWRYGDKKLKSIFRDDASSSQVDFVYNPFGQRVMKIEKSRSGGVVSYPNGDDWKYTYYAYDANGQVMAVYEFSGLLQVNQTVTVEEYNIYGSSREGQIKTQEVVWQNGVPNVANTSIHQNTLGERNYEVTNHLGNVLAVITDRNTVVDSTYEAVVVMTSDYYPFGMVMPRSCKDTIIAAHHDEEDVDYTNLQRTSVDANGDLNTTSSQSLNQGWLSGASSVQTVNDDDYIEFEIENISTYNNNFLVGLSFQDNSTNLYESAYGFFVRNNGSVSIHLGSSTAVYTTSRSVGDKFRIERDNGTIRFKKNGVTIYSTTDTQQSTAMYADVSMWFQTGYVNRVYNLVVGKFVPETTKNVCYGNWQDASFGKYRYAYNGMEVDNEVSGNGNSYTTEFRQYDPRLGRWKSLDPLMAQFPWQSPYCAFDNNPIYYVDPYGLSASTGGPDENGGESGGDSSADGEWTYHCDENNSNLDGWVNNGSGQYNDRFKEVLSQANQTLNKIEALIVETNILMKQLEESFDSEQSLKTQLEIELQQLELKSEIDHYKKIIEYLDAMTELRTMINESTFGLSQINFQPGSGDRIIIDNLMEHYVGEYVEGTVEVFWVGVSYGAIHWKGGWDGYMTENPEGASWRTELVSLGVGGGLIFTTGDPGKLKLENFAGRSWSADVNASAVAIDGGIQIVVTDPYDKYGNRIIMIGGQISGGVATPYASGGVNTNSKTTTYDW